MYDRHGWGLVAALRPGRWRTRTCRQRRAEPEASLDLTRTGRRRQVQQAHVLDVGPLAVRSPQRVIAGPERQRREQLFPEAIPGKRARLADQKTDDVALDRTGLPPLTFAAAASFTYRTPVARREPRPSHGCCRASTVEADQPLAVLEYDHIYTLRESCSTCAPGSANVVYSGCRSVGRRFADTNAPRPPCRHRFY